MKCISVSNNFYNSNKSNISPYNSHKNVYELILVTNCTICNLKKVLILSTTLDITCGPNILNLSVRV